MNDSTKDAIRRSSRFAVRNRTLHYWRLWLLNNVDRDCSMDALFMHLQVHKSWLTVSQMDTILSLHRSDEALRRWRNA